MKKKIISACVGIVFFMGLILMIYPTFSNWLNNRNQTKVVAGYQQAISKMTKADYTQYLEAARKHNEKIAQAGSLSAAVHMEEKDNLEEYNSLLNISGNGVMGIIRIPKMKVSLPIYHTTQDVVLQVGVGHYTGSSLPVGGRGTHCILSGHTGLPSAKLFTELDQMKKGDTFYMDILGDTLAYQVDQVSVVLPAELENVNVEPDKDYVTLVTCTPYGVNSHRLLVRGTRIPYVPEEEEAVTKAAAHVKRKIPKMAIFAVAAFIIAVAAGTVCGSISSRKSKKKKRGKENEKLAK